MLDNNKWQIGYKEVKNFIHNELKLTDSEIKDAIHKVLQNEVRELIGSNGEFIQSVVSQELRSIIKEEMIKATVGNSKYPQYSLKMNFYDPDNPATFSEYISGVIKEEIIKTIDKVFDVKFDVSVKQ